MLDKIKSKISKMCKSGFRIRRVRRSFDEYEIYELQNLLDEALVTDGAHHKQYYLEKIGDKIGLLTIIEHEPGIAP